jgi:hypothetical protein
MAYSKAYLKTCGSKAFPCYRPYWIGKLPEKCLPIWTSPYVSFKHILNRLSNFMGTPNFVRILYNTTLPTESQAWRMPSSGMLRCVDLVRTDVSEERKCSIIRVTRIGELGTTLAVTSNWNMLNIQEDSIFHSHRCENLKFYTNHRLSWSLWIADVLSYCIPIFSPVSDPLNRWYDSLVHKITCTISWFSFPST